MSTSEPCCDCLRATRLSAGEEEVEVVAEEIPAVRWLRPRE